MNLDRFKVRARRLDNSEWIEGLVVYGNYKPEDILMQFSDKENDLAWAIIDPSTIEPIAMKVSERHTLVGNYICPSCGAAFIEHLGLTNYCGECGQRLDWEC